MRKSSLYGIIDFHLFAAISGLKHARSTLANMMLHKMSGLLPENYPSGSITVSAGS